jgi:hypothetical protein
VILTDTEPALRWEDGFVSGNGRHGALLYGRPEAQRCVITHHSLVLPNGSESAEVPLLADRIDQIRDLILAGDSDVALAMAVPDGPHPAPQPFHPAFAIDLVADGATSGFRRTVDFDTGVVGTEVDGMRSACFVSRAADVVAWAAWCADPTELAVRHVVSLPGCPDDLDTTVSAVLTPDGAISTVRVDYPRSGGYVGVTRLITDGRCRLGPEHRVLITQATHILLLTRVARCATDLRDSVLALPTEWDRLLADHVALHGPTMRRMRLELGATPTVSVGELLARPGPALLEVLFESGRYLLLSASGLLPPRLPGLWQGDWHAAWSGAITCDANVNLVAAAAATTAVSETIEALVALIEASLPDWRHNAARLFGARGIVAPAHTDGHNGRAYHFSTEYPLHLWTAGANWLLTPLLDHIAATRDTALLARITPILGEVARFYQDFLDRVDQDGNLVIVPSYSPENHPIGQGPAAINATMDIAAARHALRSAIDVRAGADDEIVAWQRILDRLPPYRINDDCALAEWGWPTLTDRYDHRHVSHLYPVWPLREITPWDTPKLADAATTALTLRTAENDSAHGHLHRALCAARLGERELVADGLNTLLTGGFFFRGLMSSHYPAGGVYNADTACGLPGLLVEALVAARSADDDRAGRIVLLPAVPDLLASGRIEGVPTVTGVTVRSLEWDLAAKYLHAIIESVVECIVEIDIFAWKSERVTVRCPAGKPIGLLCSTSSTRIVKLP